VQNDWGTQGVHERSVGTLDTKKIMRGERGTTPKKQEYTQWPGSKLARLCVGWTFTEQVAQVKQREKREGDYEKKKGGGGPRG